MATITTRPNATVDLGGGFATGAATAHAATSDDNDASFLTLDGAATILGLAEPTVPSGAVLKSVIARVRCGLNVSELPRAVEWEIDLGSGAVASGTLLVNWTSARTVPLVVPTTALAVPTAAEMTLGTVNNVVVREVYLDTAYVPKPVVTITGPTGTITTNDHPTVTWETS